MKRLLDALRLIWRSTSALVAIVLIVIAFVIGLRLGGAGDAEVVTTSPPPGADGGDAPAEYTCSMHPQIRLPDPDAKCPICFMDLIRVESEGDVGERAMVMTPAAMKLAEIQTTPVVRMLPRHTVRLYGDISYDETRVATIAAYFPGRLDRLYVDYTGIAVRRGDHLVSIYSPDLVTAEAELLTMRRNLDRMRETVSDDALRSFEATVEGAREKLRLWGLTPEQIRAIEETGVTSDNLTIYSPMGGIVIEKHKVTGDYVKTGEAIFSVADLSGLWLRLDAYESDVRWLRHGQAVEFTTGAYPGEAFRGTISFIDPVVSVATRTAGLRVNVDNADGRLKPGMFVRAVVRPIIGGAGAVIAEDLAGQWVCPMHPEVVKAEPSSCDLCGMDLVEAESLGYVTRAVDAPDPLVIPASAALITGRRAVVYVQLPDRPTPTFEGREIVLGPRAGASYIVREDGPGGANLAEGEMVVVNGAFKIDSALQIAAKPSMMNPQGGGAAGGHDHGQPSAPRVAATELPRDFLDSLKPLYAAYFDAQEALARDDVEGFVRGARDMHAAIEFVDVDGVMGETLGRWRRISRRLLTRADEVEQLSDLSAARSLFEIYARAIIELDERFGHGGSRTHYVTFCPMAFDNRGAPWLARTREVTNPYFGASMLRCGTVKSVIAPSGAQP